METAIATDSLEPLAYSALGSRSKRLSDYCFEQVRQVYTALSIGFEPTFYPYISHIARFPRPTILDLASGLGISHPAASKMTKRMAAAGLVVLQSDKTDRRNKRLHLTPQGEAALSSIRPVLDALNTVMAGLDRPAGGLLDALRGFEVAFAQSPLKMRVLQHLFHTHPLHLQPYSTALHDFYETHNRIWVQRNFVLEPSDIAQLTDPKTHILDKGGRIYILCLGDYPVGGFSLLNEEGGRYQLSKMYVPETLHGLGVGNRLLPAAIEEAQRIGCRELYLLSNTLQAPAIHLYRKYGFIETPLTEEGKRLFARANIKMAMAF